MLHTHIHIRTCRTPTREARPPPALTAEGLSDEELARRLQEQEDEEYYAEGGQSLLARARQLCVCVSVCACANWLQQIAVRAADRAPPLLLSNVLTVPFGSICITVCCGTVTCSCCGAVVTCVVCVSVVLQVSRRRVSLSLMLMLIMMGSAMRWVCQLTQNTYTHVCA